ncbi:TonB-dependent receptor [Pedobacter sp. MR2016-24]|uniref:TonB-dependent receptor n=1 Tax=Pedobacter sp. MR2016-24 TaxID=2994466 RepID=UPI0022457D5F|nr:TonB-dependent receptor [Pedobacter sp. MR2016-24]MCX2484087.1 TonB-dependent receptor [Pedobacter sp. MR2016-24]
MNTLLTRAILLFVLCSTVSFVKAQSININGYVSDKLTKEPIPGVSITIKGTTVGTATGQAGKFSLRTTEKVPFTLVVSFLGYTKTEYPVNGNTNDLNIELESASILGQEVVISASRTPERILESPVSIERMSAASIKDLPAPSFYDALNNMKGVEISTQSLTFKSVNTRGFNSNGNTRFNQYVDGMDNQAPGLNFSVGNIVGITELDVDNVELLPGASSALYGAGGINGTLLMTSKNPFDYQGASFQFKSGINHVNDGNSSTQPFKQLDVRLAKAWNNKFGIKGSFSFLQAKDWVADDYSNFDRASRTAKGGDRSTDPNYDGINVYGDEVSQNMRNVAQSVLNAGQAAFIENYGKATGGLVPNQAQINGFLSTNAQTAPFYAGLNTPGLIPNQNVSRTGYKESDLVDYNTQSLKTSTAIYYRFNSTIEAVAQANWGTGTSVYTGSDRYSLRNFSIGQYKLELKGQDFFLRGYTTQERSGDSYISSILGSYINEQSKVSQTWFPQYIGNYVGARLNPGITDAQAHAIARSAADQGRYEPGSVAFETAKEAIINNTISSGKGAKFDDKTNLYHYEGMYNFSNILKNVVEFQIGSSYRKYQLRSAGTIFDDLNRKLDIDEYGAFAQLGKKMFNDKFKLTVAGRYDKNQNFEGRFTPRVTGVFTVAPNQNIRASFQTGYRNPTTQNQYIDLAVGGGSQRLIGGLPEILNKYELYDIKPYTDVSYRAFLASAAAGTPNPALLQSYTFDPKGVRPESVKAYEVGYKALLGPRLLLDAYAYYNQYKNFITSVDVYQNKGGTFTKFGVPVNAAAEVNSYGAALGLDYLLGQFNLSGNVSYNKIGDLPENYINDFNTPEYRFNFGIGNKNIIRNVGFNVNYRWQDRFYWNSSFASGDVPAYGSLDAQVNLKIPAVNSMIKIGGSNVLNNYYITSFGNPKAGALYYIAYTFNP